LSRPEAVARRLDPRDRLFRRARRAVPAAEIFPQGLFEPAARHHVDLQYPRERRADRGPAGRGGGVPSRHDPRRGAEQGDIALFRRNSLHRRQHAIRERYAAYDTLDPAIRDRLEGRKAMHHYNYGSTQKGDDRGTVAFAECTHPVFRTHEDTGRKAVYVN